MPEEFYDKYEEGAVACFGKKQVDATHTKATGNKRGRPKGSKDKAKRKKYPCRHY